MATIKIQRNIALLSVGLFLAKLCAYYITHSVTVLTDALEGIVNVIAGFLGLFSVVLASKPRDTNHLYGHSKAEFLSSGVEGTLIIIAGCIIIWDAIQNIISPHELAKLDIGLIIVAAAGSVNFFAGKLAIRQGNKHNSAVLVAEGKHLVTDSYSTVAVIVGLLLIIATHNQYKWLDGSVAILFATFIIVTGLSVVRRSISGIMDETDMKLLKEVILILQQKRLPQWVDLHNMRVIQNGHVLHIDAHMTLPWYYSVKDADKEIHNLEAILKIHYGAVVEPFIHIDGCMPYQCRICALKDCPERKEAFNHQLEWSMDNIWKDIKHGRAEGFVIDDDN